MKARTRFLSLALVGVMAIGLVCNNIKTHPQGVNANIPTFSDVPSTFWAHKYVETAADHGWVAGVGGGKYEPNTKVTSAQYITMLMSMFYSEDVASAKVKCIEETAQSGWWYPYCMVAVEHDLLGVTEAGISVKYHAALDSYTLNSPIMRYDMAELMSNVLADKGHKASDSEKQSVTGKISDLNQISDTYRDCVTTAYALGVISGMDDGTFSGKSSMTRAQAAVTLYRMYEVVSGERLDNGDYPEQPNQPETKPEQPTTPGNPSTSAGSNYDPADVNKDGVLTEDEVYNALMEFKKEVPEDTPWGDEKVYWCLGAKCTGCAAFAYEASDKAFNGPERIVTNVDDIRVGDIFHMSTKYVEHWGIVTKIADGNFYSAQGNVNGKVTWQGITSFESRKKAMENGYVTVYTRYPD